LEERLRRELKLNSFRDLEKELEKIEKAVGPKTTGIWSVYQILQHLTDMLHGSMHGFPKHQPKIVRMTVGKYMYKKIIKSGVMRQGYPNASAPAKREDAPIQPAIQRLRSMITEFENYNGHTMMHPFFDRLNKDEWTKLHLIHFSLHLSFITNLENSSVKENISPPPPPEPTEKIEEPKTLAIEEEASPASEEKEDAQVESAEIKEEDIEEEAKEEVLQVREKDEIGVVTPIIETPNLSSSSKKPELEIKPETTVSKKGYFKEKRSSSQKERASVKEKRSSSQKERTYSKEKRTNR